MNLPSFEGQPTVEAPAWVKHRKLIEWVQRVAAMTKPDRIVWCDGSQDEYDRLCAQTALPSNDRHHDDLDSPRGSNNLTANENNNGNVLPFPKTESPAASTATPADTEDFQTNPALHSSNVKCSTKLTPTTPPSDSLPQPDDVGFEPTIAIRREPPYSAA